MPFDPLIRRSSSGLAPRPELTQGALVSGLRLSRYGSASYAGFFITARCDLAHVRTDTVNFLPVVPLAEWVKFDGCIAILLARLLSLETKLEEFGETFPPGLRAMIGSDWKEGYHLFIETDRDFNANNKAKLRSCIDEHIALSDILTNGADSPTAIANAIEASDVFRQLVEREWPKKIAALLENRILDAHFIPVVQPSESLNKGPGYVILFRQILSLPGSLLEALKGGVTSIEDLPATARAQANQVLACPSGIVANVASPHVEHILQRFSNVFGRVGVPDSSRRYREWIVKTTCEGINK